LQRVLQLHEFLGSIAAELNAGRWNVFVLVVVDEQWRKLP